MTVTGGPRSDEARDVGEDPSPSPRSGPARWQRSAAVLLTATTAVMAYQFLFQLTKPSPLANAAPGDLVPVVAYALLFAGLVALVTLPVAVLLDALGGRVRPSCSRVGTVGLAAVVYCAGLLAFAENLLYTSQGFGLKTDDGLLLKLVYGVFGGAGAVLLALTTSRMSARSVRRVVVGGGLLGLASAVVVGVHLAGQHGPAPLEAKGTPATYDVVVLSSDGVDARRMSVYGYGRDTTPFLERKAGEFRVFDNAFTNNGNTTGSITALLTGVSPMRTHVVYPPDTLDADDARRSLPHLLGDAGYYRSNWAVPHYADAHEQNLVDAFDTDNGYHDAHSPLRVLPLGAGPARWYVHHAFEDSAGLLADVLGIRELPNPYSQVSHIVGDTISDDERLSSLLEEIRDRPRLFAHVHFMVSHGPWFDLSDPLYSRGEEQKTGWQRDFYDDSIREFDSYVEAVYQELEQTGKLDHTLLVVTSDHGVEYDATKRVPMLVRFPEGAPAGRVETNVQRLDVAPTVLDVLGYEKPSWMAGQSLLHPESIPDDRQIVATTTATRVFPQHFGFRPRDGDLLVTYIRCGSYVTVRPSGQLDRGRVAGSTAACTDEPEPPRG